MVFEKKSNDGDAMSNLYRNKSPRQLQRVPFGLGLEKTTGNSAWFLARMKCSTVKSSGEFSSAPTLHSSPPPPFVLLSPLFLFVVGRPSTSTIEVLRKRYTVLSPLESLSSHADIYALTPWFVKNYPRISRPALRNPLRDRSFSPPSDVRLRSRLPFSLRLLPSGIRAYFRYFPLASRKNFRRVARPADKLRSRCPSWTNYGTPCGLVLFRLFYRVAIFFRFNSPKSNNLFSFISYRHKNW